jgi:F420H(2)-dependent quinone reductase
MPVKMRLDNRLVRIADLCTQLVYRLSGGRLGARQLGCPVLLLTCTGRHSGKPRTHALLYLPAGDDLVVVASNNGSPRHPAWYLNLRAKPEATVRCGRRRARVIAEVAEAWHREQLWLQLLEHHPPYAGHQARTSRRFPIVILRLINDDGDDLASHAPARYGQYGESRSIERRINGRSSGIA